MCLHFSFMIEDCRTLRKEKAAAGGYSFYN